MASVFAEARHSAFSVFFQDHGSRLRGNRNEAMKEWNKMTEGQRKPYEERALVLKDRDKKLSYKPEPASRGAVPRAFENFPWLRQKIKETPLQVLMSMPMKLVILQYAAEVDERHFANEVSVIEFNFSHGFLHEQHFFPSFPSKDIPAFCMADVRERFESLHRIPFDQEGIDAAELEVKTCDDFGDIVEAVLGGTSMVFCICMEKESIQGGFKALIDYFDMPTQRHYVERLEKVYEFEDLLHLTHAKILEDAGTRPHSRDYWTKQFKDTLEEAAIDTPECRCSFHCDLDETDIKCTFLTAHAVLHKVFELFSPLLSFALTKSHIHVPEKGLRRCSSSYYASFPDDVEDEQFVNVQMDIPPLQNHFNYLESLLVSGIIEETQSGQFLDVDQNNNEEEAEPMDKVDTSSDSDFSLIGAFGGINISKPQSTKFRFGVARGKTRNLESSNQKPCGGISLEANQVNLPRISPRRPHGRGIRRKSSVGEVNPGQL